MSGLLKVYCIWISIFYQNRLITNKGAGVIRCMYLFFEVFWTRINSFKQFWLSNQVINCSSFSLFNDNQTSESEISVLPNLVLYWKVEIQEVLKKGSSRILSRNSVVEKANTLIFFFPFLKAPVIYFYHIFICSISSFLLLQFCVELF